MAGGEAPEEVKKANDARYMEYKRRLKIERRLQRKILEDPGTRPDLPEPSLHPVLPGPGPPPPPSSWGASSIASEATAENLLSGTEDLMSQQERPLQGS